MLIKKSPQIYIKCSSIEEYESHFGVGQFLDFYKDGNWPTTISSNKIYSILEYKLETIYGQYLEQFCEKQDVEIEHIVSDSIVKGGIICIADAFFTIDNIIMDMDRSVPKDFIFEWYWDYMEYGDINYNHFINKFIGIEGIMDIDTLHKRIIQFRYEDKWSIIFHAIHNHLNKKGIFITDRHLNIFHIGNYLREEYNVYLDMDNHHDLLIIHEDGKTFECTIDGIQGGDILKNNEPLLNYLYNILNTKTCAKLEKR